MADGAAVGWLVRRYWVESEHGDSTGQGLDFIRGTLAHESAAFQEADTDWYLDRIHAQHRASLLGGQLGYQYSPCLTSLAEGSDAGSSRVACPISIRETRHNILVPVPGEWCHRGTAWLTRCAARHRQDHGRSCWYAEFLYRDHELVHRL